MPEGSTWKEDKIIPQRSFGIYFLLAPFQLLGMNGVTIFIALAGIITIIFFYLFARQFYDKHVAGLATVLFSFSFPMIYWSNMIFSNIPAVMFFMIGLFFVAKVDKEEKLKDYILASLFFALSVWIRYEYIILVAFIIPFFIYRLYNHLIKKNITKKELVQKTKFLTIAAIVFIILLTPILALNKTVYGSAFSIGYTTGYDLKEKAFYIWS